MSKLRKIINQDNIETSEYDVFIETGLYLGHTLKDLYENGLFDGLSSVYTIEIQKHYIDKALNSYGFLKEDKFNVVHGDSAVELEKVVGNHKDDKIIFWLDAHFSGGNTGKSQGFGECPLMGELDFIKNLTKKPVIIIDDIEAFIEFPKSIEKYHNVNDWPSIKTVKEELNSFSFDFDIKVDRDMSYLIAK